MDYDKPKPLTKKQKFAAILLAHGKSVAETAKHPDVGVSDNTVRKWMKDPAFTKHLYAEQDSLLEEFRHKLTPLYLDSAAKAVRVLRDQMRVTDPETGKPTEPYLRQNAAREMLTRAHTLIDKTDDRAVEIHFVNMPQLGSPKSDDSIPIDASNEINRLINE